MVKVQWSLLCYIVLKPNNMIMRCCALPYSCSFVFKCIPSVLQTVIICKYCISWLKSMLYVFQHILSSPAQHTTSGRTLLFPLLQGKTGIFLNALFLLLLKFYFEYLRIGNFPIVGMVYRKRQYDEVGKGKLELLNSFQYL